MFIPRRNLLLFIFLLAASCITSHAGGQSGVTIELDRFGVESFYRPGDLTPIRLKLTSQLAQPTPVWVQWQVPNADGDIGEYGRSLTLTPNVPAFTWLYAPLPPEVSNSSVWTVRVFEERDGERRAEVGGDRISPALAQAKFVDIGTGMIAVIGQSRLGLDGYERVSTPVSSRLARPFGAHEDTRIVHGIRPNQLPDRWYGLMGFEAVAWSGDREYSPQSLGIDQAEALREYVRRGGHLVISLPAEGNPWGLGVNGQNELEDLLPCRGQGRTPRRDESVPLDQLLPTLSKYNELKTLITRNIPSFSIRVFKDLRGGESGFNVIDNHYEPLISLPDGRVIAIQRQYGFGRVTVIGLDLADGRYGGLRLPQADAFWNRVLGRRMDTPSASELAAIETAGRLGRPEMNHENGLGSGPLVTGVINMRGDAGKGLLLALLLFAVYWLLAGPGGFGLLKHYGKVHHAWVAFALCACVFTAIAWGGVNLFPKRTQISHLTILDHVARTPEDPRPEEPQYQRAISYFSAYVPRYGLAPIAIESAPDQRDVVQPWAPPGTPLQKFPNVDRYRVDVARDMEALALPARSTATQLQASWLGGLHRDWGGTLVVDPSSPIEVVRDANNVETQLRGRIVNELPGTLTNVTIIWVKNNRMVQRRYAMDAGAEKPWLPIGRSGLALNSAMIYRQPATPEWTSGTSRNLAEVLVPERGQILVNNIDAMFIKAYAKSAMGGSGLPNVSEFDRRRYLEALSFFQQINPPEYLKSPDQSTLEQSVSFHRELGRELDLSAWFNRPCLIIMGFLENSPNPVPLRIDGQSELPVSRGLTMVRWIYPLPLNEQVAFREVFETPNE